MIVSFALLLIPLILIGVGVSLLITPLDILWLRQERFLSSRGVSPKRSSSWEESARGRGWVFITSGLFLLLFSGVIMKSAPIADLRNFLQEL